MLPTVQLLCQFGNPVRGLSPYGDELLTALQARDDITVKAVDYQAPYPASLHPAEGDHIAPSRGELHWANPLSWWKIARQPYDILHIQHWVTPMATYLCALTKGAIHSGKRVIVTVHNAEPHEHIPALAHIENAFLRSANALVVHDRRSADSLRRRLGRRAPSIHTIPLGIRCQATPSTASRQDYRSLGLDPTRRYICLFGNLRGYKGIDVLLEAWSSVASDYPNVDLIIAGRMWSGQRGATRVISRVLGLRRNSERLLASLQEHHVSNRVHLLEGFLPDAEIDSLLRISQFAVFPYVRFASQSAAACRAAGHGCPVLVTNVGGLPDLAIDNSWVVEPNNHQSLGNAIARKLDTEDSDNKSRHYQLDRARSFEWDLIAHKHADLYQHYSNH